MGGQAKQRTTMLGTIRELHRAHELLAADARAMHRARVAITDVSARQLEVEALVERCGGAIVPVDQDPTIVVADRDEARKARRVRGTQRVVDEIGLRGLVDAYEAVYSPPSVREAARRARQRLAVDLMGAELETIRRREAGRSGRGRKRKKVHVSDEELKLQNLVRGLRAKGTTGSLVQRG